MKKLLITSILLALAVRGTDAAQNTNANSIMQIYRVDAAHAAIYCTNGADPTGNTMPRKGKLVLYITCVDERRR